MSYCSSLTTDNKRKTYSLNRSSTRLNISGNFKCTCLLKIWITYPLQAEHTHTPPDTHFEHNLPLKVKATQFQNWLQHPWSVLYHYFISLIPEAHHVTSWTLVCIPSHPFFLVYVWILALLKLRSWGVQKNLNTTAPSSDLFLYVCSV